MVGINHPSDGFYEMQSRAATLFAEPGPPDMAAVAALAASYQVEVLGPPLAPRDA